MSCDWAPCACYVVIMLRDHDGIDRTFGFGRVYSDHDRDQLIAAAKEKRAEWFRKVEAKTGRKVDPNAEVPWWSVKNVRDFALVLTAEEVQHWWEGLAPCAAYCQQMRRRKAV